MIPLLNNNINKSSHTHTHTRSMHTHTHTCAHFLFALCPAEHHHGEPPEKLLAKAKHSRSDVALGALPFLLLLLLPLMLFAVRCNFFLLFHVYTAFALPIALNCTHIVRGHVIANSFELVIVEFIVSLHIIEHFLLEHGHGK